MKIALIIVSYNSYGDIVELLDSIQKQKRQPDMIIVVDNCSPNGDGEKLKKYAQEGSYHYVSAPKNGGFAYGCNVGIQHAKILGATHIGLINPDAIIHDPGLLVQVKEAFAMGEYGIIGTYVINSRTQVIEFGGADIISGIFYPRVRKIGEAYIERNSILRIEETDYTTGSSLFFPLSLFEKIGQIDESYFLYFEETDWCLRARLYGYKIGIISSTAIEHKTSQSIGFRSGLYVKYMIRNYGKFALRYALWYELPLWFLLYIGFWIPGQIVSHLYRKYL